jgi:NADH-quinone oxidoreductase subunit L
MINNLMSATLIHTLAPWVVLLPFIGLLLNLFMGRRWGEKGTGLVASLASSLAFAVAVALGFALVGHPDPVIVPFFDWIHVGRLNVDWTFRIDTLSVVMMLVVAGIGTLIHIYATGYMHADVHHQGDQNRYTRFFIYFNLFILAMMVLVSANNYLMLFVGWEGVGLCSYLLIGFWFEKGEGGVGNAKAAKKAFIVNRIGDFGLLLAIFMLFWWFGTLDFTTIFEKANQIPKEVVLVITLLMFLGVTGKSAQLPLYIWLPDAMAGPTPVSALIHAATMVTAGVYLITRSNPLFQLAPLTQNIVMWVGALTALFAATIAVAQFDIKKVLAYSTISQLGFMIAAAGMGAYAVAMFHLIAHAFFKALLFLAAGSVILGMERGHSTSHHTFNSGDETNLDPQDMRQMGGLHSRMPVTFWVYLMGALALAGIAPLAGFFSKDEILADARQASTAVYIILSVSAFLTAFYIGRQVFMIFWGGPRSRVAAEASESSAIITVPLIILAILTVFGGVMNLPTLLTLEGWLEHSLYSNFAVQFDVAVALLSISLAIIAFFFAWWLYGKRQGRSTDVDPLDASIHSIFIGMHKGWWIDRFYQRVIVTPYREFAAFLSSSIDQMVIDGIVTGMAGLVRSQSQVWRKMQTGYVRTYGLAVLLGLVVILIYLIVK